VPPDEPNNTRACERHPSSAVVASCDACGRSLCLRCAVPVRGRVYGDECLAEIIGGDLVAPPVPPARWRRPSSPAIGVGFAIAAIATLLPWQRFGQGAGFLGAYGLAPRYSLFCAVAALVGLAVWGSFAIRTARPGRWWLPVLRTCGTLVVVTAILHVLRPPSIGPASVGPWLAMCGGLIATVASFGRSVIREPSRIRQTL